MTKEGRALRPESLGRVLAAFLSAYFPQYVDYGFTAGLEEQLDAVSGVVGRIDDYQTGPVCMRLPLACQGVFLISGHPGHLDPSSIRFFL